MNNYECNLHKNNIQYCEYCCKEDCNGLNNCIDKLMDKNYINNFVVKTEHINGIYDLPIEYVNAKIRQINVEKRIFLIKETKELYGKDYII
jgi:hypothetical protein